ncbi:MAG: DUF4111 domain-containing protein [Chloroflexi bacterium]|nr:DUF4111 domain-containing protein [Chloroflexota bacterium]
MYTPYEDVNQILNLLLEKVQEVLQDEFVGMYLYGSLATGDFDLKNSDIDFAVVTQNVLPGEIIAQLESMHKQIWVSPSKWAAKLEGSYLPKSLIRRHDPNGPPCPTVNEGSFYIDHRGSDWIIQRHVIREQGIILAGPDPKTLIDPVSAKDIREAVLGVLNEWWFPMLENPAWLVDRGSDYHAYAIISMCRALHAIEHGVIFSKPVAADWAKGQMPEQAQWIETALRSQNGGGEGFAPEALNFIRLVKDRVSQ